MKLTEYMTQRGWAVDAKRERKRYLSRLARKTRDDPELTARIGSMLIYNQVIEQFLVDIVQMSVFYMQARIWPVVSDLELDLEKATFGKLIDYFKDFALHEPNRDQLLSHLRRFNTKRNQVVHDLFDIKDLNRLARELEEYAKLADEIIRLLDDYDDCLADRFRELEKRTDFPAEFRNTDK